MKIRFCLYRLTHVCHSQHCVCRAGSCTWLGGAWSRFCPLAESLWFIKPAVFMGQLNHPVSILSALQSSKQCEFCCSLWLLLPRELMLYSFVLPVCISRSASGSGLLFLTALQLSKSRSPLHRTIIGNSHLLLTCLLTLLWLSFLAKEQGPRTRPASSQDSLSWNTK